SENEQVDGFIRETQLNCFAPPNSTGELEGPQPPLRVVYRATWNQNILYGTLKWWVGEMEKQNANEIYRIIYEEASHDVKQHGIGVGKNMSEDGSKKKFISRVSTKFGHMRGNSKSSKDKDFADWCDRVVTRVEHEVAQKILLVPDKQYTGTTPQYVALKHLIDSQGIAGADFVHELQTYYRCMNSGRIPQLYGISRDPETKDFVLVTQYAPGNNLRQHINENFENMDWWRKVALVFDIAKGLRTIHGYGFVHHNFHSGNVLIDLDPNDPTITPQERMERLSKMSSTFRHEALISDLGISIPATEFSKPYKKKRYGVLPYMAPEVLQGGECSRPSDIYSFAIVMWELTSGELPYQSIPHDKKLAKEICDGKRPEITQDTPKFYANLMERCWDQSASKRPDINEIVKTIGNWRRPHVTDSKLFDEAEKIRKSILVEKGGTGRESVHEEAFLRPCIDLFRQYSRLKHDHVSKKHDHQGKVIDQDISRAYERPQNFNTDQHNTHQDSWKESILLDPEGPYSYKLPRQKRAPPPESWDFKHLSEFEQKVFMNPYGENLAAIIGSPIRKCFYHERWFANAKDEATNSTWIVPDFVNDEGARRPGKGRWLKASSKVIQAVAKEGDIYFNKMLVEKATGRLQKFFRIIPSRRFPARRDRVLLHVLSENPFEKNSDKSSMNIESQISSTLHFIGKEINDGNGEDDGKCEIQRFYVNNAKPIDGLQCVFELELRKGRSKINGQYEKLDGNVDSAPTEGTSQGSSEFPEYFQQVGEPGESKVPPKPFGTIHPVTYRVLDGNDGFIEYQTQFVPFYNIYDIWGVEGVARFKGFMKIPSHKNPRLGLITHKNTKQLALSLWKLRGFVV
ncbi:3394_t:CDS:2, partial [Acaulospora colombiana]